MFRSPRLSVVAAAAVLALCAASVAPAMAQQPQGRPRVAVLNFANNSTWSWWGDRLGEAAADELVTQLVKTGDFTVIERAQLSAIMSEQKLGQTGAVDSSTAARIGKLLGVQFILTGSITQFSVERTGGTIRAFGGIGAAVTNAEAKVDVRLVSTDTGEILVALEGQGNRRMGGGSFRGTGGERTFDQGAAQEALRPAIEQVVQRIAQQKGTLAAGSAGAPGGQVVGLKEKMVYINRGQGAGVTVGQRFNVSRVTDEIKDADGRVLDRVVGQVAVIEVTQVLSQSSVARIVSGDVRVNDTIE